MDFQEFKDKYEHKHVEEFINQVPGQPVVSVCVQTYNHAAYIRDCLDGILMQQSDFNFEILLGDDDSNDGTREICLEYAQKYPQKIRLFLHHRENNIKINGRPSGRFNLLYSLYSVRGKYIALCEGDDYWIDPLKLQKQLDFLEKNKDCSLVFTGFKVVLPNGKVSRIVKFPKGLKEIDANHFLSSEKYSLDIRTLTLFFRREILDTSVEDWMAHSFAMDFVVKYKALIKGHLGVIHDVTAVYNALTPMSFSKRKITKEVVLKEFIDYHRGLLFLTKHSSNVEKKAINRKTKTLREDAFFKIARSFDSDIKGILYMVFNLRSISIRDFLIFNRRLIFKKISIFRVFLKS